MIRSETDPYRVPFALERLVTDAMAEALRHEDASRFFGWLRAHIEDYYTGPLDHPQGDLFSEDEGQIGDPRGLSVEVLRTLSFSLGRAIWNAMPLPGNGYRPRPLPVPAGQSPCPCGSGRNYAQCCARRADLAGLAVEDVKTLVLVHLPAPVVRQAASRGGIPLPGLVALCADYLEQNEPRKVLALLEPVFEDENDEVGEVREQAMNLLGDAYDALGYSDKKAALRD